MTIQQAAQQALDIQNASNLSGVAITLSETLTETIWPEALRIGRGTEWVNQHPIVTLFLDKLNSLNRIQCFCDSDRRVSSAYDAVHKMAQGNS